MKIQTLACGFVLGAVTALVAGAAFTQQKPGDTGAKSAGQKSTGAQGHDHSHDGHAHGHDHAHDHGQQPSPEEMQAMMKTWMDAMTPGEQHKHMQKAVGQWQTVTKIWMSGPTMPPTETPGTTDIKSVLDGRFILQSNKSSMMMPDMNTGEMKSMPWEGLGLFGYDNYQKMYVGCWVDTMGTHMLTMKGNLSQDGKTMTMYGEMDEPMLGVRGRYVKYVTNIIDDNKHVFEIYDLHAGDNYKVVEVVYTRKK